MKRKRATAEECDDEDESLGFNLYYNDAVDGYDHPHARHLAHCNNVTGCSSGRSEWDSQTTAPTNSATI
jgi:hypothetical protein